jgi:flagellar motor protein MotB
MLGLVRQAVIPQALLLAQPDAVIDGYPEYRTSIKDLDPRQSNEFHRIVHAIFASLFTKNPVRAVVIVGHADRALRIAAGKRKAFEQDISEKRAESAQDLLSEELNKLAASDSGQYLVYSRALGVGATMLKIARAANEAQMRKNRRVEFRLFREGVGAPNCDCKS